MICAAIEPAGLRRAHLEAQRRAQAVFAGDPHHAFQFLSEGYGALRARRRAVAGAAACRQRRVDLPSRAGASPRPRRWRGESLGLARPPEAPRTSWPARSTACSRGAGRRAARSPSRARAQRADHRDLRGAGRHAHGAVGAQLPGAHPPRRRRPRARRAGGRALHQPRRPGAVGARRGPRGAGADLAGPRARRGGGGRRPRGHDDPGPPRRHRGAGVAGAPGPRRGAARARRRGRARRDRRRPRPPPRARRAHDRSGVARGVLGGARQRTHKLTLAAAWSAAPSREQCHDHLPRLRRRPAAARCASWSWCTVRRRRRGRVCSSAKRR